MAESITITDNRTGESVEIPLEDGGVVSSEWAKLMPGVWFKDEGLATTAITNSAITYIDGDAGVLEYRGYPIEQLAQHSTFLEVAYLLVHGELPEPGALDDWVHQITTHTFIHENFRKRASMRSTTTPTPWGCSPRASLRCPPSIPRRSRSKILRFGCARSSGSSRRSPRWPLGRSARAWACRSSSRTTTLSYTENFLSMMFRMAEPQFAADPVLARALDVLFILHADHEQNCSTTATRVVGSSHADPYSAVAAGCAALYGPRHGGANEAVLNMLDDIGSFDNVDAFVESVKRGEGRLMGFGHRVYKNYDPRAQIIKDTAHAVFRGHRQEPDARHRAETRRSRPG